MLPVDTAWFDDNPEKYLNSPEFIHFQELANVDLKDLKSSNTKTLGRAQGQIASQSVVVNEVRKEHAGYGMPFISYTHDLNFGDKLPNHKEDLDKILIASDLFDSLRRRHMALSHVHLPLQIDELFSSSPPSQLRIVNLGSGVGLDLLNALQQCKRHNIRVDNYDVNPTALNLGQQIANSLVKEGMIKSNTVYYHRKSLTKFTGSVHLAVMVGIICGVDC